MKNALSGKPGQLVLTTAPTYSSVDTRTLTVVNLCIAERNISRGEKVLSKLSANGVLSKSGEDFLVVAIDPMHDLQLKDLMGWPDLESSASIVRCVKQSESISKPGSLAAGNWDCHIFQFQTLDDHTMKVSTRSGAGEGNNILVSPAGAAFAGGSGLCAYAVPTGTDLDLTTAVLAAQITLGQSYNDGASRLIALGHEVVNTTAPLNKQGSVTSFRLNQPKQNNDTYQFITQGTNLAQTAFSASIERRPPASIAEAMLLPGSRTWEAAEGVYQVTGFLGQDNPPMNPTYTQPIINKTSATEDRTDMTNVTDVLLPNTSINASRFRFDATKIYPIHSSGCIFTGLSEETTLTMFQNAYIESFPGPAEPEIVVLATPSATYDPVALEILSVAMSRLPVAVPAKMNGFGDWFLSAVESVANFVAPVATALVGPGAGALALGVGKAAGAARNYMAQPSPQNNDRFLVQRKQIVAKKKNKNKGKRAVQSDVVLRR